MESLDYHSAFAALTWQIDLGIDEAILDAPVDRYALEVKQPKPKTAQAHGAPAKPVEIDPVAEAQKVANAAGDLAQLRAALADFPHCDLRKGAQNLVFSDGVAPAPVMLIGEAPGRDEDRMGKPFVGKEGALLDKMLAAIQLSRADSVYITTVLPWRPPQGRDPKPEDIAMMKPFLKRHIDLVAPKVLILMGNVSCSTLLGKSGVSRLRGHWAEVHGVPAMPMFHPTQLLRTPAAKREAWADLLDIRAKLGNLT